MTIHDIINKAEELRRETAIASVDPNRVGTIMSDTLRYINEAQIFADALVHRIYASEEEFANDKEHYSDLTGKPMKAGCIIYIQSTDTFYRYDGDNIKTVLKEKALDTLLAHKANKEGVYPNLIAGDLAGHGESVEAEFSFRATGGKSIKDGAAYIKELQGNAVVWNQLVQAFENATEKPYETEYTFGVNNSITIKDWYAYRPFRWNIGAKRLHGHKMLALFDYKNTIDSQLLYVELGGESSSSVRTGAVAFFHTANIRFDNLYADYFTLYLADTRNGDITISNLQLIDLTLMFGAGNEPTTIEEYNSRKPIVADEYAYNNGEVIAFNGDAVKSVGDNALNIDGRNERVVDEEWEPHIPRQFDENVWYNGVSANGYGGTWAQGSFAVKDGKVTGVADRTSYGVGFAVRLLPDEEYYISAKNTQGDVVIGVYDKEGVWLHGTQYVSGEKFTTPSNAAWGLVVVRALDDFNLNVDVSDIMLTLVHSGWKVDTDAGYQPYWADTLQIDSRIREAFPQGMHKWDKVYNKDGKGYIVKGTGVVDLGTLGWASVDDNHFFASHVLGNCGYGNILCAKYTIGIGQFSNMEDKTIGNNVEKPYNEYLFVRDDAYTDTASFKAAMAGVMLYYELAEPTIEEYDTPFKFDYKVADFGTEELLSEQPSAPFKARTIYQFNAVDQIRENANDIKTLETKIAELQSQIATLLARG